MALIPITEAAKLGLLPREFEEFFPGIARSSLFGSPLTLNLRQFRPGAGPLERGVGRFGFQHGVPGVAGVRFGLGPLLQGLGLSPGPSAVTAPGVVPGGRARAGAGGAPSAGTLAGRAQPQDIEAIRRLLETGQLDPRTLPPGLMAALLGGAAPRPTATRTAVPLPPRAAGPSGIAQPLAQTRQALTTASAAEQLVRAIQGIPPGSFERPPGIEAAFQAQRAGERAEIPSGIGPGFGIPPPIDPLTGLPTESAFGAQIAAEGGAQGLRTIGVPQGVPESAIPADVTAGIEAGVIPPTEGGGLTLPSAGQTLGGLLTALQLAQAGQQLAAGQTGSGAIQAARGVLQAAKMLDLLPAAAAGAIPVANIALGGLSLGLQGSKEPTHSFQIREAQERQGVLGGALAGLGSQEATMANMVFPGAGLVLGPVVGALRNLGVFGQHRTLSQKLRAELLEAGRIGDTLRGPIGAYGQAQNLEDFFNVGGHVGYLTQPAEFVRRALTDPNSIMAASSPGGSWGDVSAMGVRTGLLGSSIQATVQSAIQNARRLAEQPEALAQLARAEYTAQRRALESQATEADRAVREQYASIFDIPREQYGQPPGAGHLSAPSPEAYLEGISPASGIRGQIEALGRQFAADPYSVLPPDFQALRPPHAAEIVPPSSAAPVSGGEDIGFESPEQIGFEGPLPGILPSPADLPSWPGTANLPSGQRGRATGPPSLARGGVVPSGGIYRLEAGEMVVPADGGRVIETRKDGNLYVPVDGGPPERAKKNPDPQRFWRVVMSSQEAQDAIRSGDPAETPILANLGTMLMGPQKRTASLEFLRRAQHQNPAGTLGDALSVASLQEPSGLSPPIQRGLEPRFGPPERLFNPPAPLEEEFDRENGEPSGGGTGARRVAQAQPSLEDMIEQERRRGRSYLGGVPALPRTPQGASQEELERIRLLKEMNVPLTPAQQRLHDMSLKRR